MKLFISTLMVMSSLLFSMNASAIRPIELLENVIESEALSIKLSNDLTGVITGKICDRCETVVVKITPDTQLFVNNVLTNLTEAKNLSGKPGAAAYDIKTRNVTKILIQK
jgi:hypothetical protein